MDQKELLKSVAELIDETLGEIEELKKSDRFSASEIKLDGPGEGLAGKPSDGSLGKEEDEDEDEEEDEEKKKMKKAEEDEEKKKKEDEEAKKAEDEEKKKKEDEEAKKAEGKNSEADPNAGKHQVVKDEGKNSEADPNAGKHQVVKAESDSKTGMPAGTTAKAEGVLEDKPVKVGKVVRKSEEESETLMKSYVDSRLSPIEAKLESLVSMVKELANAPVPRRGFTARDVQPLTKSVEDTENLSKSQVVEKLFELKKSGASVNTVDITSAELGSPAELAKIIAKYNIK